MGWAETRYTLVNIKKYIQNFGWKFLNTHMRKLRGWIISRCTVKKRRGRVWAGFSCLRKWTNGGLFWRRQWAFEFYDFRKTSLLTEWLFTFQGRWPISYLFFIICRRVSSAGRIPIQSQRTFLTVIATDKHTFRRSSLTHFIPWGISVNVNAANFKIPDDNSTR